MPRSCPRRAGASRSSRSRCAATPTTPPTTCSPWSTPRTRPPPRTAACALQQAGDATFDKAAGQVTGHDLQRAEIFSIPITLIILILAFGALVAASVPLLLGLTSVMAALGGLAMLSHALPMDDSASSLVVLIGLAVGVDYSLFYIRREREERRAGRSAEASLDAAAATVGRAILVSGMTVIVALAGLLMTGIGVFVSMARRRCSSSLIAVIGSLTVLPATLALARRPRRQGPDPGLAAAPRPRDGAAGPGRPWPARSPGARARRSRSRSSPARRAGAPGAGDEDRRPRRPAPCPTTRSPGAGTRSSTRSPARPTRRSSSSRAPGCAATSPARGWPQLGRARAARDAAASGRVAVRVARDGRTAVVSAADAGRQHRPAGPDRARAARPRGADRRRDRPGDQGARDGRRRRRRRLHPPAVVERPRWSSPSCSAWPSCCCSRRSARRPWPRR